MRVLHQCFCFVMLLIIMDGCRDNKNRELRRRELQSIDLMRGEITLCGSGADEFGKVEFSQSCIEKVRENFNLATALLHSFEYPEAEKVFVKVIDEDPDCLMAYWGVAMSNFHPLWAPPTKEELEKGSRILRVARSIESRSEKESDYLEAVAVMFTDWNKINHQTRLLKFEKAAETIYQKYPEDKEAAIFYALALRAASSPEDKTFAKQRKAGAILNALFSAEPDHPGIAHYLIHTFDYPELAELALPAARKYASIAAASAHAQHMPSHIFTRLGLWDESIQSNAKMISAAQCYAESSGMKGHWDEELHGIDYIVYAYLQQGRDKMAAEQVAYLNKITEVFPINNKEAYAFAAVPARYALERRDWKQAAALQLKPAHFPWDNFLWERSIVSFARVLGAVNTGDLNTARTALEGLKANHARLLKKDNAYEARQVHVQVLASEGWIQFLQGNKKEAIRLMTAAAENEDATEKHPVTPGEVIPARELLGDMYLQTGEPARALEAYEASLKTHTRRFNGLYGAGLAASKSGDTKKATAYFRQLMETAKLSDGRPEMETARSFLSKHM